MKKCLKKLAAVLTAAFTAAASMPVLAEAEPLDGAAETRRLIELVNDRWISGHLNVPGYDWANAAYFVGNTQAYLVTGIEDYRNYALSWGERNLWSGPVGSGTDIWTRGGVFHADNQTCFQTYIDLYFLDGDGRKLARAEEVMDSQIHTAPDGYWDWDDATFMAMPVMSRLYRATGDRLYADRLWAYFSACRDALYDSEYHIFFRDGGYVSSRVDGLKNFWARGNGWVMAALAQTLRDMPEDWEHYGEMLGIFKDMAAGAAACMKDDGQGNKYWTQSMLPKYPVSDANPAGYETSGTAFMTYALMYGINAGLLDAAEYLPYAMGGMNYLKNVAIKPDGTVGYVQEVGSAATEATASGATQNFGVGATLLALCELYKYQGGLDRADDLRPYLAWRLNNTAVMLNGSEGIYYGGEIKPSPKPQSLGGGVYLPLRALAETLGYTVEWDGLGYASAAKDGRSFAVSPGSAAARVNGRRVEMPAPAESLGGTLYLSAESAAAVFGLDLQTDSATGLVYLGYKLRNLQPCEAGAERLLLGGLSSGALPPRPEQTHKGFEFIETAVAAAKAEVGDLIDTEAALPLSVAKAASVPESANPPANALDGDMNTRYAAINFDAVFDLGEVKHVSDIALSFWQYESRTTSYELSVSVDGVNYSSVYSGSSVIGQAFDLRAVDADVRYIRVVGRGNSNGNWTSLLEIIPFE